MGYRLEISELEYKFCAGKLFGYVKDTTKLKSHQWLLNHNYIDGDEYWSYGCRLDIVLSADEFKEFIELYNDDWDKYYKTKNYIIDKEMQELMNNGKEKILQWY